MADDFAQKQRLIIGRSAHYFCSNPYCLMLTTESSENGEKAITVGEAAHICAAAENGPRYDPLQTAKDRASVKNGVWLCKMCHTKVDRDFETYTVELLRDWKKTHEKRIKGLAGAGFWAVIDKLKFEFEEKNVARESMYFMDGRSVLFENLDCEFPDRCHHSLDQLRVKIAEWKSRIDYRSSLRPALDGILSSILGFYKKIGEIDLMTLKCNSNDKKWRVFADSLNEMRRLIIIQVALISSVYDLKLQNIAVGQSS